MEAALRAQRLQRGEAGDRRAPAEPRARRAPRRPPGASRARAPTPVHGDDPRPEDSGRRRPADCASAGSPASSASSAASSRSSRCAARRTSAAGGRRALRMRLQQRAGGAQAGLHAVAQLDLAQHRDAALVLPEARLGHALEQRGLGRRLGSSRAETSANASSSSSSPARLRAPASAASSPAASARRSISGASGSSNVTFRPSRRRARTGTGRRSGTSWPAIASASGVRKCRSTARFSGRAPRSGVKPCVEQELERGVVELDRPLARAQAAPGEHGVELGGEDLAHHRARQRPEDDRAVDPVEELGPERLRDRLLDAAGDRTRRRPARTRARRPCGPSRRGSRS